MRALSLFHHSDGTQRVVFAALLGDPLAFARGPFVDPAKAAAHTPIATCQLFDSTTCRIQIPLRVDVDWSPRSSQSDERLQPTAYPSQSVLRRVSQSVRQAGRDETPMLRER